MKTKFIIIQGLKFISFGIVIGALIGAIVMGLWNWLVPELFNGPVISFWQAIGLFILSKILFGGGGWAGRHLGDRRRAYWKQKMEERMSFMNPEEKEKFKREMKERWGRRGGWPSPFDQQKDPSNI